MDPTACFCINARRAAGALTRRYDQALAPVGLKVTQYSLLRTIQRLRRPAITALAAATGLERSTLGRNLRVLERRGLVALSPGADERERVARLTEVGSGLLRRAMPLWSRAQSEVDAMLPDGDAARATALFARLTRSESAPVPGTSP
ncbi:MAG: winged helix-turn-helix transcriptional regulator [Burkholderiales bacterium]|nr:MAG: winged helix-turn-helix transcriptional regulator [Burkholderiales bacterium]